MALDAFQGGRGGSGGGLGGEWGALAGLMETAAAGLCKIVPADAAG